MASTTLAKYRSRISNKVGLDNSLAGDQPMIDDCVNEAYEQVLIDTKCKVVSSTSVISISSGVSDYTLDTAILRTIELTTTAAGVTYEFERVAPQTILRWRQTAAANASPVRYYALNGHNMLMVYPTPSSADTVTIYFVGRPTALSASADVPSDVPAEFHRAIEYLACAEAADHFIDYRVAQSYRDLYDRELSRARKSGFQKGGARAPRIRAGRKGQILTPDVPSRDGF